LVALIFTVLSWPRDWVSSMGLSVSVEDVAYLDLRVPFLTNLSILLSASSMLGKEVA
jgi:hypothetical protein